MDFRQTYRRSSALCPHRQLHCLESAARCGTQMAPRCELQADYRPGFYIQKATCRSHAPVEMSWIYPANPSKSQLWWVSFQFVFRKRLPEGKPPFSYGFPMVFPLKPPCSHGFRDGEASSPIEAMEKVRGPPIPSWEPSDLTHTRWAPWSSKLE